MPVLLVVTAPTHAAPAVRWARRIAAGRETPCHILVVASGRERRTVEQLPFHTEDGAAHTDETVRAVRAAVAAEPDLGDGPPTLRWMRATDPSSDIFATAKELECGVVMVAVRDRLQRDDGEAIWVRKILMEAPQHVVLLRAVRDGEQQHGKMLVAAAGGAQARVALQLAAGAAEHGGGTLTALYVEPPGGPEAKSVGRRHLDHLIEQADMLESVPCLRRVMVDKSVRTAISEEAHRQYDLVLVGAAGDGYAARLLFGTLGDHLLTADPPLSVAVVRRARPLPTRLWMMVQQWTRGQFPQLNRDQRLDLADRLETGSRTNVDFIFLMAAATSIAGFGLLQNSAAVIIGAMLVAPLMTPLMGIGLSLTQGNTALLRRAAASVMWGFCTALAIGIALGCLVPGMDLTSELLARTGPSVLDWAVAFVSGVAGAYAVSRPDLIAALPGVAIAAALVPPIATVGIALSRGHIMAAEGAALLFGTNVVAIILGSALAMSAVGMAVQRPGKAAVRWVRRVSGILIAIASILLVVLGSVRWSHRALDLGDQQRVQLETALPPGCELVTAQLDHDHAGRRILQVMVVSSQPPADLAATIARWADQAELKVERVQVRSELVQTLGTPTAPP